LYDGRSMNQQISGGPTADGVPSVPLPRRFSLEKTFSALKHRNYRIYFWGQMVSLFGTWMQITAQGFLAYRLTHSAAFLGTMGFAGGLPTILLMLYGGVVADRIDRRKLMLLTQTAMAVLAFLTAVLAFTGLVRPWQLVLLALSFGVANAFDAPARQSIVVDLVDRKDLTNAIALNSTMFNTGAVAGPAAGGILYALTGPGWCFVLNGLSFFAVIAALLALKVRPRSRETRRSSAWLEVKEGIRYVFGHSIIRTIMGLILFAGLFGSSFSTIFPAWAVKVLGRDAAANGLLHAARGAGALLSALAIASLGHFHFKGRLLAAGSFAFPLLLFLFAMVRVFPVSLVVLVGAGAAVILVFNLANALIQTLVEDRLRGRVMSIYSLTFFGFMPLGSLWIGLSSEKFGEPLAVILNAVLLFVASIVIFVYTPELSKQE
jgi:MFS family permease